LKLFKEYHDLLIQEAEERKIPIHFLRYEDLVSNPSETLTSIFKFILGVDSLEGTVLQKRIDNTVAQGHIVSVTYRPKSLELNNHEYRFDKDLFTTISKELEKFIYYFGYVKHPTVNNPYGYFKFEKYQPEFIDKFERFKVINK
jgi:hypothetical protein